MDNALRMDENQGLAYLYHPPVNNACQVKLVIGDWIEENYLVLVCKLGSGLTRVHQTTNTS